MVSLPAFARAFGAPVITGVIKSEPEHFQVREWLGFEADGEGDHVLLTVRKRNANTLWVARALARHANIHPRDIGFAGLKDRQAITEQAFTLPLGKGSPEDWREFKGEGFEVLSAVRQRRKLRRGAHKGNDFRIVVDDIEGDRDALAARMSQIQLQGIPNYFGPQRFGRQAKNLKQASAWFTQQRPPRDRAQRGFALSAARSLLFNEILSRRIEQGDWNVLREGDVANLDGSGSVFPVPTIDSQLQQRCAEMDIHPTGAMWGSGELLTSGSVAALEQSIAERHTLFAVGLAANGLNQERRSLRAQVRNLAWTLEGAQLILEFRLSRGSFATAVIAEIAGENAGQIGEWDDA